MRLKNAQNLNMLRTYPKLRKGEEVLFWMLQKITETLSRLASTDVRQCALFLNRFYIAFFAGQNSG